MPPPDRLWAESELSQPDRHRPEAARSLADRLASLPDAHPAAWLAGAAGTRRSEAASAAARWRAAGDTWWRAARDAWWRGERDAWWRGPDPSASEAGAADEDGAADDDGLPDSGELADDYATGVSCPASGAYGAGDARGDGADDAGPPGESGTRPAGPGGRATTARPARATGPHHARWHGRPAGSGGHAGRDPYRPWFSPDAAGDPWFAAGQGPPG